MTDATNGNIEQVIRLFFSIDMANATEFKYGRTQQSLEAKERESWPSILIEFFNKSKLRFRECLDVSERQFGHRRCNFRLWKTQGDEVLFYSSQTSSDQPYWMIRSFLETVHDLNEQYEKYYRYKLGIKGTVWTAGFPIRNKRYFIHEEYEPSIFMKGDDTEIRQSTIEELHDCYGITEFVGLEMDQGFRLAQYAYPGRVLCSPDACFLVCKAYQGITAGKMESNNPIANAHPFISDGIDLRIFHVGWKILKGVLNECPVPLLWPEFLDVGHTQGLGRNKRFCFETFQSDLVGQYCKEKPLSPIEYIKFFANWGRDIRNLGADHIEPYIKADENIDKLHLKMWGKAASK
jgi:hypothetical protein